MEVNQRIVDQFYQDTAKIKQNVTEKKNFLSKNVCQIFQRDFSIFTLFNYCMDEKC